MTQTPKMVADAIPIIDPNRRNTDILSEEQIARKKQMEEETRKHNEQATQKAMLQQQINEERQAAEQKAQEQQRYNEREKQAEEMKEAQAAKESDHIHEGRSIQGALETPMTYGPAQVQENQAEADQGAEFPQADQGEQDIELSQEAEAEQESQEPEPEQDDRAAAMAAIFGKLEADRSAEQENER